MIIKARIFLLFFHIILMMNSSYKIFSIINIVVICLLFSIVDKEVSNKTIHNILPITICVDPGHGGKDGGAIYGDYVEKDINLDIGLKLKEILLDMGYNVVMTRSSDYHLPINKEYTKLGDLNERIKLVKESDAFILISIHANKYELTSVHGAQTFYRTSSRESMVLASLIQKNITSNFDNNSRISKSIDNIYLLNSLDIPAVIVESGFMSNSFDLNNITNPDFQEKFANIIADSINEFLLYY